MINKLENEIIRTFNQLSGKYTLFEVFNDFLEMSALSLRNSFDVRDIEAWKKRENRFIEMQNKYDKKEFIEIAEILGKFTIMLNEQPNDYLGRIFMKLDLGNKWKGQFFTPYNVSKLMASLTFSKEQISKAIEDKGYVSLNEPTVGAGAIVIATYDVMKDLGFDPKKHLLSICNDIDIRAVYMSYIQLSLLGIPAVVSHQNTLTQEKWDQWKTPAYYCFCANLA